MQNCFARVRSGVAAVANACLVLLVLLATTGCAPSALSGLTATKGERLVVKQAKNDPFPSPSDVGIKEMTNHE